MNRKAVSGMMLTLLLVGMLTLAFKIQPVKAEPATIIVPDDFLTIQEAINHANSGDVVYVRSGAYYESIVINKSISVVGELPHRPLLDGDKAHWPVKISADNVTFSTFRVRRSMWIYGYGGGGIYLANSNSCVVTNNEVMDNQYGIGLYGASNNIIHDNLLEENHVNILCKHSMLPSDPLITSRNNTFVTNILRKGDTAFALLDFSEGRIIENTIMNNSRGVTIESPVDVMTYHNNFINNTDQILFRTSETCSWDNGCEGNYWSDYTGADADGDGIGDTPYIIDENNQDNYPLMEPWYLTEVDDTEAYMKYVNETIQDLPDEAFNRPPEDVPDVKNDFSDLFYDVLESIDAGNYEGAIEKLNKIKEKMYEEIVESDGRQEIISLIDDLIAYLQTPL